MATTPRPLIAVVGPTAVGKTRLAIELCQRFGGEVINADSRQVYRGMEIGTAKPTPEERFQAPHHLLDLLDPPEPFGIGMFLPLAAQAAFDIAGRGRLPILAGGSGQYIWAMLEGQTVPSVPPDLELRAELEREAEESGSQALHDRLRRIDPVRADAIDHRNVRRVVRALEIYRTTNRKPSEFVPDTSISSHHLVIGLTMDRQALYQRIDERVDAMMAAGFLAEVERLAQAGFPMGRGALDCPGYRELGQHLEGKLPLEDAVSRTKTQTHRLVRRQYTWFKAADPRIRWLDASAPDAASQARELVSAHLSS
ncbi:MAG: tRNA (adenosine(37)-N6)-dimethylallyltransferase MiaA [Chloroflexi bacterium]|nr:tRNA (adenosine(37)-N6)-dimethylallyltransferase MiaA [Chloroflexota bacterium]MDA1270321.1 tRNA (adenosine(37)-N6)-dimethylallyltransferase MiaA [Chloroflexota bacterium]